MFKSIITYIALGFFWLVFGISSLSKVANGLAGAQFHLIGGLLEVLAGIGFIALGFYRKYKGQIK